MRDDPPPTGWPRPEWTAVALQVQTDVEHGGRWTSLTAGDREWLWRNPDPEVVSARGRVRPGAAFVDAGGVEECLPTVNGLPDHGAVWSVPWTPHDEGDVVVAGDLRLIRTITAEAGAVSVAYSIAGPPGTPFVHAVHALLDVGPQATLVLPGPQSSVMLDDAHSGGEAVSWPPTVRGLPADQLGPADGTAVAVLLPGCHEVVVVDGEDALHLRWRLQEADPEDPCSLLVWRNLGGWPAASPYRSIGIEPMVGRTTTVGRPGADRGSPQPPAGAALIPPARTLGWQLRITAWRSTAT